MRLIEIPDDGIVREFIWRGDSVVGERRVDLSYLPTIEAEPVRHGRWIERSDKGVLSVTHPYVCNVCGRTEMLKEPYCNCGAKMDGGAGNDND